MQKGSSMKNQDREAQEREARSSVRAGAQKRLRSQVYLSIGIAFASARRAHSRHCPGDTEALTF